MGRAPGCRDACAAMAMPSARRGLPTPARAALRRCRAGAAAQDARVAFRSIASLSLSFGLVSIPVKVYSATESSAAVRFKLLSRGGQRVRRQYVADDDEPALREEEVEAPAASRARAGGDAGRGAAQPPRVASRAQPNATSSPSPDRDLNRSPSPRPSPAASAEPDPGSRSRREAPPPALRSARTRWSRATSSRRAASSPSPPPS